MLADDAVLALGRFSIYFLVNSMKPLAALLCVCLVCPSSVALGASTPDHKTAPVEAPPPPPTSKPGTLVDGTAVKMRLGETLSSESAKVGQQVPLEVTEDVLVDGVVVIPKGSNAIATVTTAQAKRRMGRGGKLDVNVDSTHMVDGQKVQLRAVRGDKGGGHVGGMTVGIVATSLVFFPAAPLFLLMHGKDITIPEGTPVTAFVQGDTKLDMAKMTPPGAPGSVAAAVVSAASNVTVNSSVVGADIEVDGAFVGNTPSTVSVPAGKHTITVKKKGYADWTRIMNLAGPTIHLNADLEAQK